MKQWRKYFSRYKTWAIVSAGSLLLLILFYEYAWYRMPFVKVTVDGKSSPTASVYRYHDNTLLVCLNDKASNDVYLVHSQPTWIGMSNDFSFVFLPGIALGKHVVVESVEMDGPKTGIDARLRMSRDTVEFVTEKSALVRISLSR